MELSPTREETVGIPGNLIVRTSAGIGRTHAVVSKTAKDTEDNHTRRAVTTITFTIKVAQEIKGRPPVDIIQHFIGTDNSFTTEEIIRPLMKGVYGSDFDKDMSTDCAIKVEISQDGIDKINVDGVLCSYHNNERNFILDSTQEIVEKPPACKLYSQAKYFKIYIDEYQDCDKSMHKSFMYLCDGLSTDTSVVDGEKQPVYIWRGAYPETFKSIWDRPNFEKRFMNDNFRFCQQIQNYSNLLCEETCTFYNPLDSLDNIVWLTPTGTDWAS